MREQRRLTICVGAILALLLASGPVESQTNGDSAAGALRLRTSRTASERMRFVEQAISQQQNVEIHRGLDALRQEELIATDTGAISGTVAAKLLARKLSPEQRRTLESNRAQEANRAWADWLVSPSLESLEAYCRVFGDTAPGVDAWGRLATWLRDDGRWSLAATAWRRLMEHPLAGPRERDRARRGLEECANRLQTAAKSRVEAGPGSRSGDVPGLTETVAGGMTRPAPWVAWRQPIGLPGLVEPVWREWLSEMRAHGVLAMPAALPLVTDLQVVVRTSSELVSFRRDDGSVQWQVPLSNWDWIERSPGYLDNAGFRQALLEQLGRQQLADTVFGRLASDGERVFVTHGLPNMFDSGVPGPIAATAPAESSTPPTNSLAAFHLQTGELLWRVSGSNRGQSYPFSEQFFCGVPLVIDDRLYVVGQQNSELQLLALRGDRGELLWKVVLGDVPRQLAADPGRQRVACTPVFDGRSILCPTASGAVVAVDPLTRSVAWAHRYGVTVREVAARPRGESTSFLPDSWWSGWREAQIIPDGLGELAYVSGPESDRLYAVRLSSGEQVWSVPRANGLVQLGATPDGAVVMEGYAVRMHDATTGRVLWRTELADFGGRGVLTESHAVLPTATGGLGLVELRTGTATASRHGSQEDSGQLVAAGGDWIRMSLGTVSLSPDVSREREPVAADPGSPLTDAERRWITAATQLDGGDVNAALKTLAEDESPEMLSLKRSALRSRLAETPGDWQAVAPMLRKVDGDAVTRVQDALVIAKAAASAGSSAEAAAGLLSHLLEAPRSGTVVFWNPRREVRPDLAIVAALDDLLRGSDGQARSVEETLRTAWRRAAESSDPFAVQRLAELWRPLALSDDLLRESGTAPYLGQSLLAVELRLLKALGTLPPAAGTDIRRTLDERLRQAGFATEADDYRRLFRGFGGSPSAPELDVGRSESMAAWPDRQPKIERIRERNSNVYYFPVPFDAESSPFFDRLDMSIERQGRRVRFAGGGHPGTWDVVLPSPQSSFRYLQQHVSAWGRGRVVVLRVGFELFGLAPVDERGEPAANILWHLDTLGGSPLSPDRLRLEVRPAVPGIREDDYRVVDQFGRVVAQVGPVRPEYLCYTDKGQLVCIDLLTGLHRWTRYDLPPGAIVSGDDEVVLLWRPDEQRVEWLLAIDGATLGERSCELEIDSVLLLAGRRAWWLTPGSDRDLICSDLVSGDEMWRLPIVRDSVVCVLGPDVLGVVEPSGRLRVLQRDTGAIQTDVAIADTPAQIDRVIVARDADRCYVAVSERVSQQAGLQETQLRNGYRAPFVTGPLAAISRFDGERQWQLRLEREPFAADQPKSAPVLMQAYKLPPADLQSGKLTDGVVRLIDKRTGGVVLEHRSSDLVGYATLSADAPAGIVQLDLERDTLRLWYRPRPPAPSLPDGQPAP